MKGLEAALNPSTLRLGCRRLRKHGFNRNARSIAPELFQLIIFTLLGRHHVHNHIAIVHQYPLSRIIPFPTDAAQSFTLHGFGNLVHNSADVGVEFPEQMKK